MRLGPTALFLILVVLVTGSARAAGTKLELVFFGAMGCGLCKNKGTQSSMSSVIRMMREEALHFPAYAFEGNKGYPGPVHKAALHAYGPSTIHRRSWAFMDSLAWSGIRRMERPDPQQRLFD